MTERGIPLEIRWHDPTGHLEVGTELRFEVFQTDESGERRVAIHRLGFDWSPIVWGAVQPSSDDPGMGICRVIALAESDDIYDVPHYEMSAYVRSAGGATVRPDRFLALGVGPAEYPLRFFVVQGAAHREFDPRTQKRPIGPDAFRVNPPDAATVFVRENRFYVRVEDPTREPVLAVSFPNGEVAELQLAPGGAGGGPAAEPEEDVYAPPPRAREPVAASEPTLPAEPHAAPEPRQAVAATAPVGGGGEDGFDRIRALILELRRYTASFPVEVMPPKAMKAVKDRISAQVERVRQAMDAYRGRRRPDLENLLEEVRSQIPSVVRSEA